MMRSERVTRDPPDSQLTLRPSRRSASVLRKTAALSSYTEQIPADAASSGPQLAFLTTTRPPSERSLESRYVVRSHAMHAFLQEKNGEGNLRAHPMRNLKERNPGELKGRFKLDSWTRKGRKKKGVEEVEKKKTEKELVVRVAGREGWHAEKSQFLYSQIIRHTLDGYSLLPMSLQVHTKKFLYYYNTSFTMNSSALNPEGNWISFAITDEAILHSTMALVSWHFDQLLGVPESADTLQQKGEAIRIINARLSADKDEINDGIIGAVAVLANFESMNGTEQSSKIHMKGLRRMVDMRGGLTDFYGNKVLQRVLTWSDVLYSSTWDCKPRFPLLPDLDNPTDRINTLERFSSKLNPSSAPIQINSFPASPSLLPTLESIRRISTAVGSPNLGLADRTAISNRIYRTEHDLLSLHDSGPSSPSQADIAVFPFQPVDLSEPFRLTALLYLRIVIRELPATAKMHYRLVSRVRSTLEAASGAIVSSLRSNQSAELLAWIAFIGATAASDSADKRYFIGLLAAVCGALRIEGKVTLQKRLEGICWRNGVCEGYFVEAWGAMEGFLLTEAHIEELH